MNSLRVCLAVGTLLVCATAPGQWLNFINQTPSRLSTIPAVGAQDIDEKDFAVGDLDNDGDDDVVLVRKKPFSYVGARRNVLLMNEGTEDGWPFDGLLRDRTLEYASAVLDVPGDQGFLTLTDDRDVALADLNGDGWLDVITAAVNGSGLPKHLSHPRIYMNLGDSPEGDWLGLRFENFRIPTITPGVPRFNGIAHGDFDKDGDIDLYFADSDASGAANDLPPDADTNSRLLINDGSGSFTDGTTAQYFQQPSWNTTGFSTHAAFVDVNGDNNLELIRVNTLTPFQRIDMFYNNIGLVQGGFFQSQAIVNTNAPFFFSVGDLNND